MSGNSALDMAKAMRIKSQEKVQNFETAVTNAFHEQEKVFEKDLEESSNKISSAINDRNESLIKALNSRNLELSNALNELNNTFNENNQALKTALLKSWGIMLIGLVFLLCLGCGALWVMGGMIASDVEEIAQLNKQKEALDPYIQVMKKGKTNYVILPKGAKIQDTYEAESGQQVMRWSK